MPMNKPNNIDEYIVSFPGEVQKMLQQIRSAIKETAPDAVEVISYGMPAFRLNKILVWFAAYAKHIGLYPHSTGIEAFKEELSAFKSSKGAIQFPLDKPLPIDLIIEIVKFRVTEDMEESTLKNKK